MAGSTQVGVGARMTQRYQVPVHFFGLFKSTRPQFLLVAFSPLSTLKSPTTWMVQLAVCRSATTGKQRQFGFLVSKLTSKRRERPLVLIMKPCSARQPLLDHQSRLQSRSPCLTMIHCFGLALCEAGSATLFGRQLCCTVRAV